jgi:hypothetical protein
MWVSNSAGAEPAEDANAYRSEFLKEFKTIAARTSVMEIQKKLGKPLYKSREILYRRTIEQWVYDAPETFFVEVEFPLGQDARILTVRRTKDSR